jgi:hypothetical protein
MGNLSPDLTGPVALELARAVEQLPGEHGMPGGARYELKWDGFRAGAVCRAGEVRLWSRNSKDFTTKFPDVQKALAAQVDIDCVLDGELVVWTGDRMDFDALQQRNVNTAATVRTKLAPTRPASFVVFDVLAIDGVDVRPMRWTVRRRRLEALAENWRPPLQLSPMTDDLAEAREWLEAFKASGVEGLVVKGASSRYQPGQRGWVKLKTRDTVEAIIGAVTGSLRRPEDRGPISRRDARSGGANREADRCAVRHDREVAEAGRREASVAERAEHSLGHQQDPDREGPPESGGRGRCRRGSAGRPLAPPVAVRAHTARPVPRRRRSYFRSGELSPQTPRGMTG